jgi:ribonuclease P protein component
VLGRILRSADFVRVLDHPPCAKGAHFAIHFLDALPSRTLRVGSEVAKGVASNELSTSDERGSAQPVDDLDDPAQLNAPGSKPKLWLGAVVPKRHARRAVTRSLIKRQIRAALLRRDSPGAPGLRPGLWVVRLRAPFDPAAHPRAASESLRRACGGELDALLVAAQSKLDGARPSASNAR